jgi:arylsulfatase
LKFEQKQKKEHKMTKPNIIFIFPDQWRGDCLSSLNHPVVETPFLDQIAHHGVTFTKAYTPSPSCIAARASLATGMSPSSTGRMGYRDGVPWTYPYTFMQKLRDNGYHTMCVGKTHFYPTRARLGFEELELYEIPYQDWEHPSDYHLWLRDKTNGNINDSSCDLDSNSVIVHPWNHPENLHPNSWNITRGIELLERRDTLRPFSMQLSFHRPHPPFDPVNSYFERYLRKGLPPVPIGDWAKENNIEVKNIDPNIGKLAPHLLDRSRRAYYAQLSHIDYQIGRLVRYLKGRDLLKDTWLVFSSDHGELLGDHYMHRKTNGFEGSAHIPLIIKPPQGTNIPVDRICDKPVSLQDLCPTFLELGNTDIPEQVEANSLLPLVNGTETGWKEFVHGEHSPGWQFVTDGKEKFIWHTVDDRRWFFNLNEDSQEKVNQANNPNYSDRVTLWENRLIKILAERPNDAFTDSKKLTPGNAIPSVRDSLKN